jgi:hypothetical protein
LFALDCTRFHPHASGIKPHVLGPTRIHPIGPFPVFFINANPGGSQLARSNFKFKKRQKELARKKKKEEKRKNKLEKNTTPSEADQDQPAVPDLDEEVNR